MNEVVTHFLKDEITRRDKPECNAKSTEQKELHEKQLSLLTAALATPAHELWTFLVEKEKEWETLSAEEKRKWEEKVKQEKVKAQIVPGIAGIPEFQQNVGPKTEALDLYLHEQLETQLDELIKKQTDDIVNIENSLTPTLHTTTETAEGLEPGGKDFILAQVELANEPYPDWAGYRDSTPPRAKGILESMTEENRTKAEEYFILKKAMEKVGFTHEKELIRSYAATSDPQAKRNIETILNALEDEAEKVWETRFDKWERMEKSSSLRRKVENTFQEKGLELRKAWEALDLTRLQRDMLQTDPKEFRKVLSDLQNGNEDSVLRFLERNSLLVENYTQRKTERQKNFRAYDTQLIKTQSLVSRAKEWRENSNGIPSATQMIQSVETLNEEVKDPERKLKESQLKTLRTYVLEMNHEDAFTLINTIRENPVAGKDILDMIEKTKATFVIRIWDDADSNLCIWVHNKVSLPVRKEIKLNLYDTDGIRENGAEGIRIPLFSSPLDNTFSYRVTPDNLEESIALLTVYRLFQSPFLENVKESWLRHNPGNYLLEEDRGKLSAFIRATEGLEKNAPISLSEKTLILFNGNFHTLFQNLIGLTPELDAALIGEKVRYTAEFAERERE